jgi:hypothetical protein
MKRQLEQALQEFCLPGAMLSNNGPPFAVRRSRACGLARLSVWMLRHGAEPVFIQS